MARRKMNVGTALISALLLLAAGSVQAEDLYLKCRSAQGADSIMLKVDKESVWVWDESGKAFATRGACGAKPKSSDMGGAGYLLSGFGTSCSFGAKEIVYELKSYTEGVRGSQTFNGTYVVEKYVINRVDGTISVYQRPQADAPVAAWTGTCEKAEEPKLTTKF